MTTPLLSEPLPDDGQIPVTSALPHRLYHRLPEVYRTMDGRDLTWVFKRYLYAALHQAGLIDAMLDRIDADRPVGPALPEPWALSVDELAVWRAAREARISALGDPVQAEPGWLPWLAQLVGANLDPNATVAEQRDTIRYATSGFRAGTRGAIADAARSALSGTRYVVVLPHKKVSGGTIVDGTAWEITIVTRTSETPSPGAVLGAVLRKGVKPAGAVLYHQVYEASWATATAAYPTWATWNNQTWATIEEAGL